MAVAAKVMAGTSTSSPGRRPSTWHMACSAAVPLETATPQAAPAKRATASSKAGTTGPVVSQSERSTSATARMSSSSTDWRA
ncbi:hypothetical protein DSECCO2_527490 [anaerobic digester metagenome]